MIGNSVFISYRGAYFNKALEAREFLLKHGYCRSVTLIPPNTISQENELLRVIEYFELGEMISDHMHDCDSFVFLNTPNYLGSYFTQLELHQWRYFWNKPSNPTLTSIDLNWNLNKIEVNPLSLNEKRQWANVVVGVSRRAQRQRWSSPFPAGKYGRKYYVVPCRNCGEHVLLHKKHISSLIRRELQLSCPYRCGNSSFVFTEHYQNGNFYRKPILLNQSYDNKLRLIEIGEYMSVLIQNEEPNRMIVVS